MSDPDDPAAALGEAFLRQARKRFAKDLEKIRHCVEQLDEQQLWWRPHESQNSIANIILHLGGNLGQWILHGVGGQEDVRDRPREFAARGPIARSELLRKLGETVAQVDDVLADLDPGRLLQPRRIQGFDETGLSAIFDSAAHLAGHTQEIVSMTRTQLGDAYRFHWRPTSPEQGA